MSKLDIDHLREWIGNTEPRSEMVTAPMVERFKATFDQPGKVRDGDAAPSLIHFCLAPPAAPTSELGEDGHPARGGFLPPVQLPRRMWAGGSFTFHSDIVIGQTVTRQSAITDVVVKEGRSGILCFVTVDHAIQSAGRLLIEERQDIVYCGDDARLDGGKTLEAAPQGTHRKTVTPSPTLLFRYSALTFNGHRIHYDAPYAREVEGYPGLIVHGPMQATMLVHFAQTISGRRPARFDFRSLSPLFDDQPFTLNAQQEGNSMRLWTSTTDGPIAMEAKAAW